MLVWEEKCPVNLSRIQIQVPKKKRRKKGRENKVSSFFWPFSFVFCRDFYFRFIQFSHKGRVYSYFSECSPGTTFFQHCFFILFSTLHSLLLFIANDSQISSSSSTCFSPLSFSSQNSNLLQTDGSMGTYFVVGGEVKYCRLRQKKEQNIDNAVARSDTKLNHSL